MQSLSMRFENQLKCVTGVKEKKFFKNIVTQEITQRTSDVQVPSSSLLIRNFQSKDLFLNSLYCLRYICFTFGSENLMSNQKIQSDRYFPLFS